MDLRRCQTVESIILKILSVFGIYKQTKPVAYINLVINYQNNKEFDNAIRYGEEGIKWSVKQADSSGMDGRIVWCIV